MTRSNNFDALRLIGALMVLTSHMAPISGRVEWMWAGEHSLGNLGVLIFFSISGFLVYASWSNDPDLGRFLSRRYLRMAPGLIVALASTWAMVSMLDLQGFPDNPSQVRNGSLWTIPFEVYCYLLLAGAGMLMARPAIGFITGMLAGYALFPSDYLAYFGLFFAMGSIFKAHPSLLTWRITGLLVAAGGAVFLFNGHTIIALALALPATTVWVGTQSWPLLRSAGRVGDLSYGIYIYAWPVQQVMVALLPNKFPLLLVSSIAVSSVLAWLSWHFVEAPALRLKPSTPEGVGGDSPASEIPD